MKILYACLALLSFNVSAAEYSDTQDKDVVGKTLWAYFDVDECQQNLHIYKGKLSKEEFKSSQPLKIRFKELVDSWLHGPYYDVVIFDGSETAATIYSKDLNDNRGEFKYLYLTDSAPDLLMLNSACISNIDPNQKIALNQQARQAENDRKEQERLADNSRAEEKKRADALLAEGKAKQAEADKKEMAAMREKRILELPQTLKNYTLNDLCLLHGNHLPELNVFDQADPRAKKSIFDEIKRRGVKLSSAKELEKKGKLFLGMSRCDLYISMGAPLKENVDIGKWGVHVQHIYNGMNVYSENETVTSLQLR